MCAMSGTRGSSGLGSQSKEHMDNKTVGGEIDKKNTIRNMLESFSLDDTPLFWS